MFIAVFIVGFISLSKPASITANPVTQCYWNISDVSVRIVYAPQRHLRADAMAKCKPGISFECEPLDILLTAVNMSTGQSFEYDNRNTARCGEWFVPIGILILPNGTYAYSFSLTGVRTGTRYVNISGFFTME